MGALPEGPSVRVDLGLRWGAAGAGVFVVGVAHPGGGEFGLHCFDGGAGFGGQVTADSAHPVLVLRAEGNGAFAGAVGVFGFGSVLVDRSGQPCSVLA